MIHVPTRVYILNYAALMALLLITAVAARFDLGAGNTYISLGVAAAKAALVLLFFMHVRYGKLLIRLTAGVGFFWLGILFVLALSDYLTRGAIGVPGK